MSARRWTLSVAIPILLGACGGGGEEESPKVAEAPRDDGKAGEAQPKEPPAPPPSKESQDPVKPPEAAAVALVDTAHDVIIDFDPDEPGIYLSVELEGPGGQRKQLDYLFDSGASFLTISRATARELGIEIPPNAPRVEFHTAAGKRSSPMVHLPALTVEDVRIPGLAVSICDPCETERGAGLLGLNVIREFVVQTDYQRSQMKLLPRVYEGRINRAYDIKPMVELEIEGDSQIRDGVIEWEVSMHNRSSIAVEGLVPRINFKNGKEFMGAPITRLEPGQAGRSSVRGRVIEKEEDGSALSYTLSLAEAYW